MRSIILGFDPGTRITGYGVICQEENRRLSAIDYGCIRPPAQERVSLRTRILFEAADELMRRFKPDACVVERQFILKINPQSGLTLGFATGALLLAAEMHAIPTYAYPPARAKQSIVGHGAASKEQVNEMVRSLLSLAKLPKPVDVTDALALALCHLYMGKSETFRI
jgi:crossover junction endodeoxyribonuclease RuvC